MAAMTDEVIILNILINISKLGDVMEYTTLLWETATISHYVIVYSAVQTQSP